MNIQVRRVHGHYEIYVDGEFYCSCDTQQEVDEVLNELE